MTDVGKTQVHAVWGARCGATSRVLKAAQKNARMVHSGTTIIFFGTVTGTYEADGLGYVELEIRLSSDDGVVAVPGNTSVVLLLHGRVGALSVHGRTRGQPPRRPPAGQGSDACGIR